MRSRALTRVSLARLTAFNFGIQFVWGAILAVSLQARSLELSHNGVGTYATIAAIGAALGALTQLFAGRLADIRYAAIGHRREFYVVGITFAIPAIIWFFLTSSLTGLAAAFCALQIALNVATGPYQAAIPDHVARGRSGAAASWMSAYQSLGNAAGLLVAGFVTLYPLVALILSIGLAAPFVLTLTHMRGMTSRGPEAGAIPSRESLNIVAPLLSGGRLRSAGPMVTLLVSRGLINVGFYTLLGFLLFFVRDSLGIRNAGVLRMQTALLFLAFTLAAIVGAVIAARPTDRCDKRLIVSVAVAVVVAALAALASATTLGAAYPSAIVAGAAWGAFVTSDWALACAVLPTEAMASAMGVWNVATTAPQIAAPLMAAPLVEHFNALEPGLGPRAAIVLSIVAFAAGAAYIWRLPQALVGSPRQCARRRAV